MEKTAIKNLRLVTDEVGENGFDIYLDFSGRHEYLFRHRKNHALYRILKDRPYVESIRREHLDRKAISRAPRYKGIHKRIKRSLKTQDERLDGALTHLLRVIDEYVEFGMIADEANAKTREISSSKDKEA